MKEVHSKVLELVENIADKLSAEGLATSISKNQIKVKINKPTLNTLFESISTKPNNLDINALESITVDFNRKEEITTIRPTNPMLNYSNYNWYTLTPVINSDTHVNVSRILAKTPANAVIMFAKAAVTVDANDNAFAKMLIKFVNYYVLSEEKTKKFNNIPGHVVNNIVQDFLNEYTEN